MVWEDATDRTGEVTLESWDTGCPILSAVPPTPLLAYDRVRRNGAVVVATVREGGEDRRRDAHPPWSIHEGFWSDDGLHPGRNPHPGGNPGPGPDFEPNAQIGFDATRRVNVALEYYGGLGPLDHLEPLKTSQQLLVPALNINFGPEWEFNLGAGIALTSPTDRVTLKMIMGRKLGGRKSPSN